MEELDFDPNQFIVVNPLWYVADRKSLDDPDARGVVFAKGVTSGGRAFVAVFTDRDLAERFVERVRLPDAVPVEIRTPTEFLTILDYLAETGSEHELIAIDPESGQLPRIATIARVIQAVRESLKQQGEA